MKLKINLKLIWLFTGLGIVALIAIVYAATSYKVTPGQTVTVTPAGGGNNYTVKNKTSNKTYFIPNKTSAEWNAFLTACKGRLSGDLTCTEVIAPPPPPPPTCTPGLHTFCSSTLNPPSWICWSPGNCNFQCQNLGCSGGTLLSFQPCTDYGAGVITCAGIGIQRTGWYKCDCF